MRFPVFLDTNVLYPATLADTLLRLAELDVIKPHWSSEVMTELERNLTKRIPEDKAYLRCRAMQNSFPEAALDPHNMEAVHPDNFLLDQLDLYPQLVLLCLKGHTRATARPHISLPHLIEHFERIQLRGFAAALRPQIRDYL